MISTENNVSSPVDDDAINLQVEMSETMQPVLEETPVIDTDFTPKSTTKINYRVLITEPFSKPTKWSEDDDIITLPSDTDKNVTDRLRDSGIASLIGNTNVQLSSERLAWLDAIRRGSTLTSFDGSFVPTVEDEASDFTNNMEINGASIKPRLRQVSQVENQSLKGEAAVWQALSYLGQGSFFQVPLWHTGIWVTLRTPSDDALVELHRSMISDKIRFGRSDYGLPFSNVTTYTTDRLVDFVISHIDKNTLSAKTIPDGDLKKVIVSQDIPSLLWGLACSIYPQGFQYRRACTTDPEKCTHIVEELLALSELQFVNKNALTDWQRQHMFDRKAGSKSYDEVKHYISEMKALNRRVVKIKNNQGLEMEICLKSPTVSSYVSAGYQWIGEIIEAVETVIEEDASSDDKEQLMIRHAQASSLRQYGHWVESFKFGTNTIEHYETILSLLKRLSADKAVREGIMDAVTKYINESTVSVIALPVYDCPACGTEQRDGLFNIPGFVNLLPLDPQRLFFFLLVQRMEKMSLR